MRGLEHLTATNRNTRLRAFEDEARRNPGILPGGTGTTGLMSGDARGYSEMLNRQKQYVDDLNAEDGKGPLDVQYGGVVSDGPRLRQPNPASALRGLGLALPRAGGGDGVPAFEVRPDSRQAERALLDATQAEAEARGRRAADMGGERDDLRVGRHQRAADYDLEYREPGRARHRAVVGDIDSEAKAGRAFLPNAARLDEMQRERVERDLRTRYLDPARLDAESRITAAELQRQGQVGAADRNLQGTRGRNQSTALNGLLRALEAGSDGKPMNPLAGQLLAPREGEQPIDALRRVIQELTGSGGGGGDDLDMEDAIAELMAEGFSREEAIAALGGGG